MARDQLAGKEMQIGRYYLEQKDYTGAINRFKVVVTKYQTTRHVEEALERLTEAYMALGIIEEAQTAAAVLGHNFPDSVWYKHAYTLVKTGGVEPVENKGSWISRAFKGIGWARRSGPGAFSIAGYATRHGVLVPAAIVFKDGDRQTWMPGMPDMTAIGWRPCFPVSPSATSS